MIDKLTEKHDKYHSRLDGHLNVVTDNIYKRIERLVKAETMDVLEKRSKDGKVPVGQGRGVRSDFNDIESFIREEYEEGVDSFVETIENEMEEMYRETFPEDYDPTAFDKLFEKIMRKKHEDGLSLRDRIRRNSLVIRQEVENAVMYGIVSKKEMDEILKMVSGELIKLKWTISRVVKSESYSTYRMSVMETLKALGSDYVVKFEEGNCGRPDHHEHDCHTIAQEDRHGLGKSIFKASDTDIVYPHTSCTSKLTIVRRVSDAK